MKCYLVMKVMIVKEVMTGDVSPVAMFLFLSPASINMTFLAFQQIPTMTISHHGGNVSVMKLEGFCHRKFPPLINGEDVLVDSDQLGFEKVLNKLNLSQFSNALNICVHYLRPALLMMLMMMISTLHREFLVLIPPASLPQPNQLLHLHSPLQCSCLPCHCNF